MKKRALVIGLDRYADRQIRNLKYAVEDARRIANTLDNAGFDAAFRYDISDRDVVSAVERTTLALSPDDLFLLYFSGHGIEINGRHLLLCEDAKQALLSHGRGGVWVDELKDLTAGFGGHRAFILDTCREPLLRRRGAVCEMKGADSLRNLAFSDVVEGRDSGGLTILCACDEKDTAQESDDLGQGLFTRAFLARFRHAVSQGSSVQLNDALITSIRHEMAELANRHGLSLTQHPWVQSSGAPPVLFRGDHTAAGSVFSPPPPPPREVSWHVAVDGRASPGMSLSALKSEIEAGRVSRGTLVWSAQLGVWTPAGQVPALADTFPTVEVASPPPVGVSEPEELELDCGNGVQLTLKKIPAGSFMMGSEDGSSDEKPVHEVTFKQPFYIGVYPVTQAQWQAVTGENPSRFSDEPDSPQRPVERVSWEDAKRFCQKLKQKTQQPVRLPSEAEWEYACRAGSTTEYCFGDDEDELELYGNYENTPIYGDKSASPVGSFRSNAWGLYDMHGNVWEWCEDKGHGDYKGAPTDGSPWLAGGDSFRVCRGGSWYFDAGLCRAAYRDRDVPVNRYDRLGLRLALSPAAY